MKMILELLLDVVLDSLKTVPFLFLSYLLIEYVEHKASEHFLHKLASIRKTGPLLGSALGIVPQCGFLVSSIRLFTGGLISFGTLAAIFISVSDEALPVLLSNPKTVSAILPLVAIKLLLAICFGYLIDTISKPHDTPHHDHEILHSHCEEDCCDNGIVRPVLKHTAKSWVFILLSLLIFETVLFLLGESVLTSLFLSGSVLQPVFASLLGLIPGCASSIMLSELYASSAISFGSLTAGLIANSGIGLVFLFRSNRNSKQNLTIALLLFVLGCVTGFILQILGIMS